MAENDKFKMEKYIHFTFRGIRFCIDTTCQDINVVTTDSPPDAEELNGKFDGEWFPIKYELSD